MVTVELNTFFFIAALIIKKCLHIPCQLQQYFRCEFPNPFFMSTARFESFLKVTSELGYKKRVTFDIIKLRFTLAASYLKLYINLFLGL